MMSLLQSCRFISRRWQQQWIVGGRNYAIVATTYLRMMNTLTLSDPQPPSPITNRSMGCSSSTTTIYHQNMYYLPLTDNYRTISVQSRCIVSGADGGTNLDPDMRNCKSIEELIDTAYDHKDMMSPRGMAAFWTLVSRLLQRRGRPTPKHEHMQMQLDQLIGQTLQSIDTYNA